MGERGRRAREAIIHAALAVFGADGYGGSSVESITEHAGCSRAAFYQYFESKEEVFRHLAGTVARRMLAEVPALERLTADAEGRARLLGWLARLADLVAEYEPVFRAWQSAVDSDGVVASGSAVIIDRHVAALATAEGLTWPERYQAPITDLLLDLSGRVLLWGHLWRDADRVEVRARLLGALADLHHRALFGTIPGVNTAPVRPRPFPDVADGSAASAPAGGTGPRLSAAGRRTRRQLLEAGAQVLLERGYHGTRVDDVTEGAGVSHGAFYRYFANKNELVAAVTSAAAQEVAAAVAGFPRLGARSRRGSAELRSWLRCFNQTQVRPVTLVRIRLEASEPASATGARMAALTDRGRRHFTSLLSARDFDDLEADALLLLGAIDSLGARTRTAAQLEAAALAVERCWLGWAPGHSRP